MSTGETKSKQISCLLIELAFAGWSATIGESSVEEAGCPPSNWSTMPLQAKLDVEHAQEFFAMVEAVTRRSLRSAWAIQNGLRLGAYAFERLYRDLAG